MTTIQDAINKINRYLKRDNGESFIVDIQNKSDLDEIVTHYDVPGYTFISASDSFFCKNDEFPIIANILARIKQENKNFFVRELSSFYMLEGKERLTQALKELLAMSIIGHVVIVTYRCNDYLHDLMKNDKRLENRICLVDGERNSLPKLVFTIEDGGKGSKEEVHLNVSTTTLKGVHHIAKAIETGSAEVLFIETKKSKNDFPHSLISIKDLKAPYEILCNIDSLTTGLSESDGSPEEWEYALEEFRENPSWEHLITKKIGKAQELNTPKVIYQEEPHWLWLYFIGLKLFGTGDNRYLSDVLEASTSSSELVKNIYRSILTLDHRDPAFSSAYEQRKSLINVINTIDEVADFCKIVRSKGKNALYYLTDSSPQEKELAFELLDKYGLEFTIEELQAIFERVYPDLYKYLLPYRFKIDLLDRYFQDYKYQKVVNKILPDFMDVVNHQAVSRDYNKLLQPRSSLLERIDTTDAQTFFIDAMGVEYLGYIMAKCNQNKLSANVTVCRCELPSITSRNKDFIDILATDEHHIIPVTQIDKIKHHGEENFDYSRNDKKLPIHLIRELEIISNLLEQIRSDLATGKYGKAILIADHGASRLAVLHETENFWEMKSKGQHSGRCCPKSDVDEQPDSATDANDFWALANYDRFKGSRKANVEVHGGATLEEVTVPIIELTYIKNKLEVQLMPIDSTAILSDIPEITTSFRKKAAVKIFSSVKLTDVTITIAGHTYEAIPEDDNYYVVKEMPDIKRAKDYEVDVYSKGNKVASALKLRVKKESGSEKNIL